MKIVEYTTNIGDYDPPRKDLENINNCSIFKNNARNSRCVKILSHKYVNADVSIYYDANIFKTEGITKEQIVKKYLKDADICICASHKNIYEEIDLALNRISNETERMILLEQKHQYVAEGVPEKTRVYGYQPLVRRHNDIMKSFNEAWWAELCRWSYRDQVSFSVVLKKYLKLGLKIIEFNPLEIIFKSHKHGSVVFPKITD